LAEAFSTGSIAHPCIVNYAGGEQKGKTAAEMRRHRIGESVGCAAIGFITHAERRPLLAASVTIVHFR